MSFPIQAEYRTVTFFEGLEVDGYRMPNGNFRVSLIGASKVLGYAENWLYRLLDRETGTSIKVLRSLGFTGKIEKVVCETLKGNRVCQTISLRDFNRVIAYAVSRGRKAALALQLSFTALSLDDFFRDAFSEPLLSIDEKRELLYRVYASTISPGDWTQMDREDILELALPGGEPHLQDGLWNEVPIPSQSLYGLFQVDEGHTYI